MVDEVLGGDPDQVPGRYAQVSPAALLPLGVAQWFIHGAYDAIVPPEMLALYADRERRAGDSVTIRTDAEGGHFDPVAPEGTAWTHLVAVINDALRRMPPGRERPGGGTAPTAN